MFNQEQYVERASSGDLSVVVLKEGHARPASAEPFCTRSQYVAYYDQEGNKLAEAHQYQRGDGSIGASGRPDPKRLLAETEILIPELPVIPS
jgi:hypothetical protein